MDYVLYLSIILSEVRKQSVENKAEKMLKLPRISSTRSGIDVVWKNSNITMRACPDLAN